MNLERKITKSGPLCRLQALNPALLDCKEVLQYKNYEPPLESDFLQHYVSGCYN
jgi:hypothetical protein